MSEESKPIAPGGASPVCEICGREVWSAYAAQSGAWSRERIEASCDKLNGPYGASVECLDHGYERERRRAESADKELASCRASLSTAEKENTRQRGEVERLRGQLKESHRRHTEAEALLADANGLNTRLQEEAALYKQRYQEKAAESQTWAAKAGAHAAENTPLQEALRELLRLYDWRFGLAEREKDPERTGEHYRETQRLLRQYGAEKKAAWSAARSVLPGEAHVDGTRSDNTSFRPLADAALAAPKASEIASDSTALEKALGALRAARDELDAATIALCAHSQPMVPRTVIEQWLSPIRRTLSGGAHVDALKAQKDQADQANPEPR